MTVWVGCVRKLWIHFPRFPVMPGSLSFWNPPCQRPWRSQCRQCQHCCYFLMTPGYSRSGLLNGWGRSVQNENHAGWGLSVHVFPCIPPWPFVGLSQKTLWDVRSGQRVCSFWGFFEFHLYGLGWCWLSWEGGGSVHHPAISSISDTAV